MLEIPGRLDLSARGLQGMHANSLRWLVNRLRYEADVEKHPEILDENVSDPIIVSSLWRGCSVPEAGDASRRRTACAAAPAGDGRRR